MRFLQFLKEGGNAVPNVVKLPAKDFEQTKFNLFKDLTKLLNVPENGLIVVGSGGKKAPDDYHGDLDIAVDLQIFAKNNNIKTTEDIIPVFQEKIKKLYPNPVLNSGTLTLSFGYPIAGNNKESVQVDVFLTDSIEWAKFAYFSPYYYESKYKGVYRMFLLSAIVKHAKLKVLKKQDNMPVEWRQLILNMSKGLKEVTKTSISKTGKLIKEPKKTSEKFITNIPKELLKIVFNDTVKESDLNSFESLYKLITSPKFIYKNKKDDILKTAAEGMIKSKLLIPPELEEYI